MSSCIRTFFFGFSELASFFFFFGFLSWNITMFSICFFIIGSSGIWSNFLIQILMINIFKVMVFSLSWIMFKEKVKILSILYKKHVLVHDASKWLGTAFDMFCKLCQNIFLDPRKQNFVLWNLTVYVGQTPQRFSVFWEIFF